MLVRFLVEVKELLVDFSLQLLGSYKGCQWTSPLLCSWYWDRLKDNLATTLVLELHELLGMLKLFHGGLLEKLAYAWKSNIVPVEVGGLEGR